MKWSPEWQTVAMQAVVVPPPAHWTRHLSTLTLAYQPLIGPMALSIYVTLCSGGEDATKPCELHTVLVRCGIDPSEEAYERWAAYGSYLEAVGLLKTYIRGEVGKSIFTFVFAEPHSPESFFADEKLTRCLQDRVGGMRVAQIKRWLLRSTETLVDVTTYGTDISRTHMEVFHAGGSSTYRGQGGSEGKIEGARGLFSAEQLLQRFPRSSEHRRFVERLTFSPSLLEQINTLVKQFRLTLKETVSLLDVAGVFRADGQFDVEQFSRIVAQRFV